MDDIVSRVGAPARPRPVPLAFPGQGLAIRPAVLTDLPFIDALQKAHTKQVGFLHRATLEGKVRLGQVLVAEGLTTESTESTERSEGMGGSLPSRLSVASVPSVVKRPQPLGYLIGHDQYFKRDDVGIIYQINVAPGTRRSYVGAALLKAQFDRSAWGCRLYCCWCAQDLEANRFWEAMGFVPLAFRAGSRRSRGGPGSRVPSPGSGEDVGPGTRDSGRIHIFWQKPIRAEDAEAVRTGQFRGWWFPSKTGGGSLREDRIVLPIPPGAHWSDDLPRVYPELPREDSNALPEPAAKAPRERVRKPKAVEAAPPKRRNGLVFDIPKQGEPPPAPGTKLAKKAEKAPRVKRVCDPRLASAARELRDRWLEAAHATPVLPAGKYDVTRALAATKRVA